MKLKPTRYAPKRGTRRLCVHCLRPAVYHDSGWCRLPTTRTDPRIQRR